MSARDWGPVALKCRVTVAETSVSATVFGQEGLGALLIHALLEILIDCR